MGCGVQSLGVDDWVQEKDAGFIKYRTAPTCSAVLAHDREVSRSGRRGVQSTLVGCRAQHAVCREEGEGCRVWALGCGVSGVRWGVRGVGCEVGCVGWSVGCVVEGVGRTQLPLSPIR